jgi:hypothetical protein
VAVPAPAAGTESAGLPGTTLSEPTQLLHATLLLLPPAHCGVVGRESTRPLQLECSLQDSLDSYFRSTAICVVCQGSRTPPAFSS